MKTVLVTGAAGFIGSNFIKKRLAEEPETHIIAVDNLLTGDWSNLKPDPRISIVSVGIEEEGFKRSVNNRISHTIDEIWNFACPASPAAYTKNSLLTIQTCTKGIENICHLALLYGSKVFHASTSEVYGKSLEPMREDNLGSVNCFGPRSCYDEGKRIAETMLMEYWKQYGVDIHIARLFNTYGPNMKYNDGRVVPNFISSCLHNDPIRIFGAPSKTRSFCYIDDTLEGIKILMNSDVHTPTNVGNDAEVDLLTLANVIRDICVETYEVGESSKVEISSDLEDDPAIRRPDLTKIKALGYSPKIFLRDGLEKTVDHFFKKFSSSSAEKEYKETEFKRPY